MRNAAAGSSKILDFHPTVARSGPGRPGGPGNRVANASPQGRRLIHGATGDKPVIVFGIVADWPCRLRRHGRPRARGKPFPGHRNHDDPATVQAGAPAYLLLLDGFIDESPDDPDLLIAGARLNGVYATVFVEDPERARHLSGKARAYAGRALCLRHPPMCAQDRRHFDELAPLLAAMTEADVPALYTYATVWAGWIQTRSGDWDAIADLPRVEAMLERVVALDEGYDRGQAHLYLGVMRTLLPPALGGRPGEGRAHFERAIALSKGRNLMAKVEFARRYARLVFDQAMHDRLLREVLAADPREPGLTLSNTLARRQAWQLLATSKDYF